MSSIGHGDSKMSARRVIFGLLALLVPVAAAAETDQTSPNLILIVTDNQSPGLLGAYGNRDIKTPHIDKMARRGAMFWSAHATSGVCSPSRATLLTGLLPSQTGVHNALPSQPPLDDWSAINEFRNLPATLKAAGYHTGLVGKYHLGRHDNAQLGFDYWVTFPSGHTEKFYDVDIIDNGEQYVTPKHLTDFWTEKAVKFIANANANEPFFLLLTYNGPYGLPPVVNAEYENRYTQYYLDHPPAMPQEPVGDALENWAKEGDPKTYSARHGITPWAAIKSLNNDKTMANLAAETAMIDDGVGAIFDALKKTGADKNTLVIYTSDQGAAYGQRGLWGNSSWSWPFSAYDANTNVPLIFWDNGKSVKAKTRNDGIVNQYDFFATIIDLLGLTDVQIENSPGSSFAAQVVGDVANPRDSGAAFFDYLTTRAVRTDKWRFVKNLLSEEVELYDMIVDPDERINVAGDPANEDALAGLDALLTAFFEQYGDPEYDLWKGGAAKGRMLDGDRVEQYRAQFPGWDKVELQRAAPFDHSLNAEGDDNDH